jgi:hypothetical protein
MAEDAWRLLAVVQVVAMAVAVLKIYLSLVPADMWFSAQFQAHSYNRTQVRLATTIAPRHRFITASAPIKNPAWSRRIRHRWASGPIDRHSREAPTASGHSAVSSIEAYSKPANTRRDTVTFLWPMAGIE